MSELEKARAGFVLSLLLFSLGLVILDRDEPATPGVTAAQSITQSITVCAATKGALCDAVKSSSQAAIATEVGVSPVKPLGSITVVSARQPAHLGQMLVLAPRFVTELDERLRLATARGPAETEVIVAQ
jgi:hypothetical protein